MNPASGSRLPTARQPDSPTARAFAAQLPLTLDMPDLNGNEKQAKLPRALPQATVKPGTIQASDLML